MTNSTVTVWSMQVGEPSPAALSRWQAVLDNKETAQAARFHADKDRHTYIAAHALTRALLAHVGGKPAASWQFAETEKGKPQIVDNESGLEFSLSHTSGFVVCAAANFYVGIDAESRDRKQKQTGLAETVLAPNELALLKTLPADQHPETFLRFWTLREAYVKATGQGINFPREDFAFVLNPPRLESNDGNWQFSTWDESRHIVSLAANHGHDLTLVKRSLAESELG